MCRRICRPKIVWAKHFNRGGNGTIVILNDDGKISTPDLPLSPSVRHKVEVLKPIVDLAGYVHNETLTIHALAADGKPPL